MILYIRYGLLLIAAIIVVLLLTIRYGVNGDSDAKRIGKHDNDLSQAQIKYKIGLNPVLLVYALFVVGISILFTILYAIF